MNILVLIINEAEKKITFINKKNKESSLLKKTQTIQCTFDSNFYRQLTPKK